VFQHRSYISVAIRHSSDTTTLEETQEALERTAMTAIGSVTLEVPDPTAADALYTAAFGLGTQVRLRASEAPTVGFRGFTLSLVVSQPATVSGLIGAALDVGATPLKPATKSLWGYGGVMQAPDGAVWKVATSSKKDTGPATRQIDQIVLLLGVADVAASKRFYVDRGLADRHWQRCRALHRSGRVHVAGRVSLRRAAQLNCTTAITWDRRSSPPRRTMRAMQSTTRQEGNVQ
jgi:uncharacterized glyoxalase superfamily protein PhnB